MFGWLTGGGGIGVSKDYESSIMPGKKGMLSEPIEDMTAEKFRAAFWKWIPNQEPLTQYEIKRTVGGKAEDKCMTVQVDIEVSGIASLLVSFKGSLFYKYLELGDGSLVVEHYGGDDTMKNLGHKTIFKLLEDPFRIEIFDEETGARRAGPFIRGQFEGDLKQMGFEYEKVEADQDSPTQPGQKSCIAVMKQELTTEDLHEKTEKWMRENGAVQKADGSLFMEVSGWISASTFFTYKRDKEAGTLIRQDHGDDKDGKRVLLETHTKVLQDPVRIERWVFPMAAISSDETACGMAGKTLDAIIAVK